MGRFNKPKSRGSGSDDENLRGRLREMKKTIQKLTNYIKHLEKKLGNLENNSDQDLEIEIEYNEKIKETVRVCKKCRGENVKEINVSKLNQPIVILVCQDANCGAREVLSAK